jgi:hypothetical protein
LEALPSRSTAVRSVPAAHSDDPGWLISYSVAVGTYKLLGTLFRFSYSVRYIVEAHTAVGVGRRRRRTGRARFSFRVRRRRETSGEVRAGTWVRVPGRDGIYSIVLPTHRTAISVLELRKACNSTTVVALAGTMLRSRSAGRPAGACSCVCGAVPRAVRWHVPRGRAAWAVPVGLGAWARLRRSAAAAVTCVASLCLSSETTVGRSVERVTSHTKTVK